MGISNRSGTQTKNGHARLCSDFKVTINHVIVQEHCPLPNIEDVFSNLNGGKVFSMIDLVNAYQQLELDNSSKELVTVSTHKGLYQYQQLPFGLTSASAIFRNTIVKILWLKCIIYLDDILACGSTHNEHNIILNKF